MGEILFLFNDYLSTNWKSFIFDLVFSGTVVLLSISNTDVNLFDIVENVVSTLENMMAILLAALAILLMAKSSLSKIETKKKKADNSYFSLFELILISMCYSVVILALLFVAHLIASLFPTFDNEWYSVLGNAFFVCFTIHAMFVFIRMVKDIYSVMGSKNTITDNNG